MLFIATANVAEQIPEALLDRLEVIRIDGYTEDEKVAIAQRFLVPRAERRNGLEAGEVVIEDEALRRIVTEYTREAGVRNVERLIQKVLRKSAKKLAEGAETPITVVAGDLRELLGRPRPDVDMARREPVAGVATGLAVTGSGGDVLVVEATEMAGKGLTLTGQLGDVMSESATIALSYVRSHGEELGIDVAALAEREVHVHVPAGAIPKDGPSAGVTMTVALVSLISGRAVRADVGMTGEVTLQGRVLPVGGIKQKVLAAHRAGLTDVILPVAQRRRPRRAPPERPRGRALPSRRPRRRGSGGRARAGARRHRLATNRVHIPGSTGVPAVSAKGERRRPANALPDEDDLLFRRVRGGDDPARVHGRGEGRCLSLERRLRRRERQRDHVPFAEHGHVHHPLTRVASPFGRAVGVPGR